MLCSKKNVVSSNEMLANIALFKAKGKADEVKFKAFEKRIKQRKHSAKMDEHRRIWIQEKEVLRKARYVSPFTVRIKTERDLYIIDSLTIAELELEVEALEKGS